MKDVRAWAWEGIKTAGRFALFAFVAALIDYISKNLADVSLPEQVKWGIALGLTGLDKTMHEWKKGTGTEGEWKGLAGF